MAAITDAKKIYRALNIKFENGTSIQLEDCWLRDNCSWLSDGLKFIERSERSTLSLGLSIPPDIITLKRHSRLIWNFAHCLMSVWTRCSSCYRSDTFQRANYLLDLSRIQIYEFKFDVFNLYITWNDKHQSIYTASFLIKFQYEKWNDSRKLRPILWKGAEIENKIPIVHVSDFLNTEIGATTVFKSLIDYGVALIDQVGVSLEATEQVCKALGGVQHTLFGGMWEFTSVQVHADTAYTNLPLAVHNDNTYFTEAAGLQILHCLEHSNGEGGETILVDGFYGATKLKNEYPEDFEFLSKFNLEAEYLEDGHHYSHSAPVINVDKDKNLQQIRFNIYDRSPMAFSSGEECRSYYRSLWNLSTYYQNTEYQWKFKLYPGLVMAMDNFRVLHGRTAFTGNRIICGSYVSRSDWLNKARSLKLIQ